MATTVWVGIAAAFGFVLPLGALLWWRRTRRAKWMPFLVGALTFFLFALVLESLLHGVVLLGNNPISRAINGNPYLYMVYGGLAAGVFEETGRYLAFRFPLRRYYERVNAVAYGIGHGGFEAMVTLGASYVMNLVLLTYIHAGNYPAATALAGGSAQKLAELMAALGAITPGTCLLVMLERVSALALHIALSIFVFLAARDKRQRSYFPFAIALHAIADMPAALYQRGLLPLGIVELWLAVFSLYTLRSARKCFLEATDP